MKLQALSFERHDSSFALRVSCFQLRASSFKHEAPSSLKLAACCLLLLAADESLSFKLHASRFTLHSLLAPRASNRAETHPAPATVPLLRAPQRLVCAHDLPDGTPGLALYAPAPRLPPLTARTMFHAPERCKLGPIPVLLACTNGRAWNVARCLETAHAIVDVSVQCIRCAVGSPALRGRGASG